MKAVEVLRKAKGVIQARGWCQGGFMEPGADPASCPVCAWGAINVVTNGEPIPPGEMGDANWNARQALAAATGETIAYWNDRPGRTVDEVLSAFDEAIASLESKP